MKHTKQILTILMCLILVLSSVSLSAFAATDTGTITIKNPTDSEATVAGKTFKVYKVFNATTNGTSTSYSWADDKFKEFFFADKYQIKAPSASGKQLAQEAVKYVAENCDTAIEKANFAEALHKFILEKNIAAVKTITGGTSDTNVVIDDLGFGYYLVYDESALSSSSVRSAVMLTTVNKNVEITLKANQPEIEKLVKGNSGEFIKGTSLDYGDEATFRLRTVIPDHSLYDTYTFKISDEMVEGLELVPNTIKVAVGELEGSKVELTQGTDYTVTTTTNSTFEIDFTQKIKDESKYEIGNVIEVTYDAKLVGTGLGIKVYKNTATLEYSNDPVAGTTTGKVTDYANVYTYHLLLSKFAEDNHGHLTSNKLTGATFMVEEIIGNEEVKVWFKEKTMTGTNGVEYIVYTIAQEGDSNKVDTIKVHEKGETVFNFNGIDYNLTNGDAVIFGLAEGKYKITETTAPDGYVLPNEPFFLEIVDELGPTGLVNALEVKYSYESDKSPGGLHNVNGNYTDLSVTAEIYNEPGTALPETGGLGTMIFTGLGVILMAGSVAYLAMRKKNAAN